MCLGKEVKYSGNWRAASSGAVEKSLCKPPEIHIFYLFQYDASRASFAHLNQVFNARG